MTKVIGFAGPIGCGKTTAALHLVDNHGFTRVRFADGLKSMLYSIGLSPAQIDGDQKEVPCEQLCGKTPRWAMQTLGTEWGRQLIGGDIWVNAWRHKALGYGKVVCDDCRFPNEADTIRRMGGIVVGIERPGCAAGSHASEHFSFNVDTVIFNDGDLNTLYTAVGTIATS